MTIRSLNIRAGQRDAAVPIRDLPLRGSLTAATLCSLVVATLVVAAALTGLLFPDLIYPTEAVLLAFLPVDLFHLFVGVPVLLGAVLAARRGRLSGLLCWPGALLYIFYSYVTNLLGVPFGILFPAYLLLVTLSSYTMIGLVATLDGPAVRKQFYVRTPFRAAGGLLGGLTALFVVNTSVEMASTLIGGQTSDPLMQVLWIADLTTIGPAALIGAVLLLRRHPLGFTSVTGLLLAYFLLFLGLLPSLLFPAYHAGLPVDRIGLGLMMTAALLCGWLLLRVLRSLRPAD